MVRGITIFYQHAHPRYHNEGRMWSSWLPWPTWCLCVMSVKPLSDASSRQRRRTSYIQPHYSSDHNVFLHITNTCALIKLCYPQVCAAYHQHSVCLSHSLTGWAFRGREILSHHPHLIMIMVTLVSV